MSADETGLRRATPALRSARGAPHSAGRVIVSERDPQHVRVLVEILRLDGHGVCVGSVTGSDAEALAAPFELVLTELDDPALVHSDGLERLRRSASGAEVVLLTERARVRSAVDWVERGAFDYLEKPFVDPHRVRGIVRRALERRRLLARNRELERSQRDGWPTPDASRRATAGGDRSDLRAGPSVDALPLSLAAYERAVLERALAAAQGDATGAAKLLGIGRSTLYRKLARHRLTPPSGESRARPSSPAAG